MKEFVSRVTRWLYVYVLFSWVTVLSIYFVFGEVLVSREKFIFLLLVPLLLVTIGSHARFHVLTVASAKQTKNISSKEVMLSVNIWASTYLCVFVLTAPIVTMSLKHNHGIMATVFSAGFVLLGIGMLYLCKK